jgi:hypothetical protein
LVGSVGNDFGVVVVWLRFVSGWKLVVVKVLLWVDESCVVNMDDGKGGG